jgi:hypothetical protein
MLDRPPSCSTLWCAIVPTRSGTVIDVLLSSIRDNPTPDAGTRSCKRDHS